MKFTIPQKLRLSTLLYNKKFTITLSVVLAFALWLGIAMTENPVRERRFNNLSADISVENTAASDGLSLGITSDVSSQKFTITVSGPNYIVSSLRAEDFTLTADTTNINSTGDKTINIIPSCDKSGFTMSVSPASINVFVDTFDERSFEITPKIGGVSTVEGYRADKAIVADLQQAEIKIKGPSTVLDKITLVEAKHDVNSVLKSTETYNADIYIYGSDTDGLMYRFTADGSVYDGKDNLITNSKLILSFTNVKVVQPIVKVKTIECKPKFINLPNGMSADDVNYSLNKKKVTIIGTPEVIDKIEYLELAPIDFREVSIQSTSFDVAANLPSGARIDESENIEVFTVKILLNDYTETTINIKNIRTSGVSGGLKATTVKNINVKVCGPRRVIRNIDASDFYVIVDLTDKQAGSHTVEAIIKSDVHKNVWQLGSYTTTVKLS